MRAQDAMNRLIAKVEQQAALDGIVLSDLERKMLRWSEVEPDGIDDPSINDRFDSEYESDKYENKIASLLHHAYVRDSELANGKSEWDEIEHALQDKDYYLLMMLEQAVAQRKRRLAGSQSTWRDNLIYLGIAFVVVVVLVVVMFSKIQ